MIKMPSFVRSGYITLPIAAGTFRYAGINGSWWSLYGDAATGAYNLVFNNTIVNPSRNVSRWHGFSLRCLSTVLGM